MVALSVYEKPVTYGVETVNQDALWKKVTEELFEDFLLFFAPELYTQVDFSKTPDFLQQELFKEIIVGKKGTKYVDQIVKVHLKSGEEKWILVHIEIQGENGDHFPKRMFQYFYRIFDKYEREVVAFAVITDAKESEKPTTFNYDYYGTTLDYAYNVFKVKDYDTQVLEQSPRLFSKVMLAAKYLNETKTNAENRYNFKRKLMREIIKLDDEPSESIRAVFYFIDYLLMLPDELSEKIGDEIRPLLKEEAKNLGQSEAWETSPTLSDAFKIEWQKGMEQAQLEMVHRMLAEGMEVSLIAKVANFDIEKVKEIQRQQG